MQSGHLVIGNPAAFERLTPEEALNLAAWLAVLADPTGDKFDELRAAIEAT